MPRILRRVTSQLEGRFAVSAILAFCMFSATFALATVIAPARGARAPVEEPRPTAIAAELHVRELVEERIHMHLKRLHALPPP